MKGLVFSEYAKIVLTVFSFGVLIYLLTIFLPEYAVQYNCYLYIKNSVDPSSIPDQCKSIYYSARSYTINEKSVNGTIQELVSLITDCWIRSNRGAYSKDILCYVVKISNKSLAIKQSWIISNVTALTDVPTSAVEVRNPKIYGNNLTLIIYNGSKSKIIIW